MTAKKMGSNMAGISRSKQILKDIQIVVKTRRNLVFLKVYFYGHMKNHSILLIYISVNI